MNKNIKKERGIKMTGLLLGALLAGFAGALLGCFVGEVIDAHTKYDGTLGLLATIILCAAIGAFMGISIEKHETHAFEAKFSIQKQTIEESVTSESLSGFERVELVKQASELNANLVGRQYDCQQWYGFAIPNSVLGLEPISLNKFAE